MPGVLLTLFANPRAVRTAYPRELQDVMNMQMAQQSREWLSHWSGLNLGPTPLIKLPDLARKLGVGAIHLKDESARSPLGSFKALGAPIALVRLLIRLKKVQQINVAGLFAGHYAHLLADTTVISATDGNHGRALAAAARSVGCPCVIVLHAQVSVERERAIAAYGASIVRIAGNYDASVAQAQRLAGENGWHVVSDTSYEGYEEIPRDVMQGYSIIAAELAEQAVAAPGEPCWFTHVFLQGGVGGLAAGVASYFWEAFGEHRPTFIVVEPEQADCLLQSAREGRAAKATGSVDSLMAGLACGEASPLAWRFLESSVDLFMTVPDTDAVAAMRLLAAGSAHDMPIVAGESGVAGLAGLIALRAMDSDVGSLDANARVLIISTEGATAPAIYEQLVGESASSVLRRQSEFLARKR
ncbi:MAG: diaminopropionate ammonia-lyase [Burkholderiaceae bacterium]